MVLSKIEDNLEVFIFTNGRSSFQYALKSIENQSFVPKITAIKDKSMIDAINYALSVCTMPYFIKIDDDFMLHDRAIEFMWKEFLELSNDKTAMFWWHLWENWSNNKIQSIKIYNKELAKKVKFVADEQGRIDIQFIGRVRKNGFNMVRRESIVAIHGCAPWTEQFSYINKWKNQARLGYHIKIRTGLMRRYKKSLNDQFNERNVVLEKVNKRNDTEFYKFLCKK